MWKLTAQQAGEVAALAVPAPATSFMIAKSGGLVATTCVDAKLRLWSLPEKAALRSIDLPSASVDVTSISAGGQWILTGFHDGRTRIWDTGTGEAPFEVRLAHYAAAAAFSRDAKYLAVAPMGEPVQVFDLAARSQLYDLEQVTGGTTAVVFSRNGARIAAAGGDTVVRIYDARTGKLLARNADFVLEPLSVDFAADGSQVLAAGADKIVAIIDTATGKALRRMKKTPEPVAYLEVSPDGSSVAIVFMKADNLTEPAPVIVLDLSSGKQVADWLPPSRLRRTLGLGGGWTNDGRFFVATATADILHIWRIR